MDSVHFILILIIIFVLLFNLYLHYDNNYININSNSITLYEGFDETPQQNGLKWWYFGNINGDGYCEDNENWKYGVKTWIDWAQKNQIRRFGITDNISNLENITNSYVIGNIKKPDDRFSILIQGYFKPNVTGFWEFFTNSDDCSYIWVDVPFQSLSLSNVTLDNGAKHGMQSRYSKKYLYNNNSYPITIIFGEQGGGFEMNVLIKPPDGDWKSNGNGLFLTSKPLPANTIINVSGQSTGEPHR